VRLNRARWQTLVGVVGWLAVLAFLGWALRIVVLEGYLYRISGGFAGDFTHTSNLDASEWWTGQGLFYGPIYVFEYLYLYAPKILLPADWARLDFVLFGIAFGCTWLALFGLRRPLLALLVLALWLANHIAVEAFANTAHLEILELTLISLALLLAVRGFDVAAGGALGLAIATKTLPGLFVPYLAVTQRWRMLFAALVAAAVPFALVCWIQGISLWDGAYALIYQGGNLTKFEYTEYEYTPRAEIARMLAGDGGTPTPEQAALAITLHWIIGLTVALFIGLVLFSTRKARPRYGLMFGLVSVAMLVLAPSAHPAYYIFLLPGWTAILADVVQRPRSPFSMLMLAALGCAYVFIGFDQPFFLTQRLFGVGAVVPEHWLAWHLPSLGLLITLLTLTVLQLTPVRTPLGTGASSPLLTRERSWRTA
jgi:hypothetical protein